MSEFKGTKGNWEYCKSELDPKKHCFSIVGDNTTTLVADIYKKHIWDGKKTTESIETAEANAKLIACAPEMLKFIKEYYRFLNIDDQKQAKQLIKKATE